MDKVTEVMLFVTPISQIRDGIWQATVAQNRFVFRTLVEALRMRKQNRDDKYYQAEYARVGRALKENK